MRCYNCLVVALSIFLFHTALAVENKYTTPPIIPGVYCGSALGVSSLVHVESASNTFRWVIFSTENSVACSQVMSYSLNKDGTLGFTVESNSCAESLVLSSAYFDKGSYSFTFKGKSSHGDFTGNLDHGSCVDRAIAPSVGSSFCGWGFNGRQAINLLPNLLQYNWAVMLHGSPCTLAGYYMLDADGTTIHTGTIQEWSTCTPSLKVPDVAFQSLSNDENSVSLKGTYQADTFALNLSPASCLHFDPLPNHYCGKFKYGNVIVNMNNGAFQVAVLSNKTDIPSCHTTGRYHITGSFTQKVGFDFVTDAATSTCDYAMFPRVVVRLENGANTNRLTPVVNISMNGNTIGVSTDSDRCSGWFASLACPAKNPSRFGLYMSGDGLGVLSRFDTDGTSSCYSNFLYANSFSKAPILSETTSSTCNNVELNALSHDVATGSNNMTTTLTVGGTKSTEVFSPLSCGLPSFFACGSISSDLGLQLYAVVSTLNGKFTMSFSPKDSRTASVVSGCTVTGFYNGQGKYIYHAWTTSDCPSGVKIKPLEWNADRSAVIMHWEYDTLADGPQTTTLNIETCNSWSTAAKNVLSSKYVGTTFGMKSTLQFNNEQTGGEGGFQFMIGTDGTSNSALELQRCNSFGFVLPIESTPGYEAFSSTNLIFVQTASSCPSSFTLKSSSTAPSRRVPTATSGKLETLIVKGTFGTGTLSFELKQSSGGGSDSLSSGVIAAIVIVSLMFVGVLGFLAFKVYRHRPNAVTYENVDGDDMAVNEAKREDITTTKYNSV